MITDMTLYSGQGSSWYSTFVGELHTRKGKIRLKGNDVTLLPDEVVKSFLET